MSHERGGRGRRASAARRPPVRRRRALTYYRAIRPLLSQGTGVGTGVGSHWGQGTGVGITESTHRGYKRELAVGASPHTRSTRTRSGHGASACRSELHSVAPAQLGLGLTTSWTVPLRVGVPHGHHTDCLGCGQRSVGQEWPGRPSTRRTLTPRPVCLLRQECE
jgi:hypothetical protein